MSDFTFTLRPHPPFRLDLTVWALRRRPFNAVDRWEEGSYRRAVWLNDTLVTLTVHPEGTIERPRIRIMVTGKHMTEAYRPRVIALLKYMLGLRLDLSGFYTAAARQPQLRPLAERFRGFVPPRFPSLFESLLNAVAFQQLSMAVGVTLLNRIASTFGGGGTAGPALPRPQQLVGRTEAELKTLGFSANKARAILSLAESVSADTVDLERLRILPREDACREMLALRGIGLWSAEYVLLRGLGRLDVFPSGDMGAGNRVARWLGVPGPLDNQSVKQYLPEVAEYRGMVYFYMLLNGAAGEGLIDA